MRACLTSPCARWPREEGIGGWRARDADGSDEGGGTGAGLHSCPGDMCCAALVPTMERSLLKEPKACIISLFDQKIYLPEEDNKIKMIHILTFGPL